MIYFDNSATTLQKPPEVAKAVYRVLGSHTYGNPGRAAHTTARNALSELFAARCALAKIFNAANPLNIALCQNATYALNMVLKSLFSTGDHLITTALEHNSVLRPLYQLEQNGAMVSVIGFDLKTGIPNYDELDATVQHTTRAVIITGCSNVLGSAPDIETVHKICTAHNLILIIDAAQSAGTFPIDISRYPNTIICFTGHKGLYGPQGTGGIVINGEFAFLPVFSGGSGTHSFDRVHPSIMPDVFEAGTMNVPSFAGLTAGCTYVLEHKVEVIHKKLAALRRLFVNTVHHIDGITVYAPDTVNAGAVVAINIGDIPSNQISSLLDEQYGIATRAGVHCAPLVHHAYGTEAQGMVRFSFSSFNTEDEIVQAGSALREIAASYQ